MENTFDKTDNSNEDGHVMDPFDRLMQTNVPVTKNNDIFDKLLEKTPSASTSQDPLLMVEDEIIDEISDDETDPLQIDSDQGLGSTDKKSKHFCHFCHRDLQKNKFSSDQWKEHLQKCEMDSDVHKFIQVKGVQDFAICKICKIEKNRYFSIVAHIRKEHKERLNEEIKNVEIKEKSENASSKNGGINTNKIESETSKKSQVDISPIPKKVENFKEKVVHKSHYCKYCNKVYFGATAAEKGLETHMEKCQRFHKFVLNGDTCKFCEQTFKNDWVFPHLVKQHFELMKNPEQVSPNSSQLNSVTISPVSTSNSDKTKHKGTFIILCTRQFLILGLILTKNCILFQYLCYSLKMGMKYNIKHFECLILAL